MRRMRKPQTTNMAPNGRIQLRKKLLTQCDVDLAAEVDAVLLEELHELRVGQRHDGEAALLLGADAAPRPRAPAGGRP